jgi:uncharacterized membrane protein YgcG
MSRRNPLLHSFLRLLITLGLAGNLALMAQDEEPGVPEALHEERVLNFHSDIAVSPDATLEVRETIKVRALGQRIKRGIYRDFPTRYRDRLGNRYTVDLTILEVQRDGKPEPFHTESMSNGERIYIGKRSVILKPGEYTYLLAYRVTRELGFFADHDELYWNVTGNGWGFPIDEASATVTLPAGIHREAILLDGYTGPQGSLGRAFESSVDAQSRARFATTALLQPEEGLTIVVSWPKGFIAPPTRDQKIHWFLEDNRSTLAGIAGLLVLLGYYLVAWWMVGKDPAAGIIMPRYSPPEGFSPAAVRFVSKMGFDHKAFAAAVINMAVKRYVTLKESSGSYVVTRAKAGESVLTADEKAAANKLLGQASSIELKQANHSRISAAIEALKTRLRLSLEKVYFLTNQRYLIPGLVISILILLFVVLSAPGEGKFVAGFMTVWLTGWSVGVFFLVSQVIHAWRSLLGGGGSKIAGGAGAIFLTLFSLPFLAGEAVGIYLLGASTSAAVIVLLLAIVLVNYLFHIFLKAPTRAGRALLDRIEGFKMFLAAVEGDRMNVLTRASKTPELFEKYLPYALALDVEQEWAEQFADVLAQAGQKGATYSPAWYSGSNWSSLGATGFASSLGSSFSGAISSSSTAPGSSSGGGGGGSSGGGGGGGGGGGW